MTRLWDSRTTTGTELCTRTRHSHPADSGDQTRLREARPGRAPGLHKRKLSCDLRMSWRQAVRLYLSSFRMGDHPEHLMGLVGGTDAARWSSPTPWTIHRQM